MRVVHVAPTRFGEDGLYGGGERYPLELARALSSRCQVDLVVCGPRAQHSFEPGGVRVRVVRTLGHLGGHPAQPVPLGLGRAISGADVVHAHQLRSSVTRLAAVLATARGVPLVVTDHGLGAPRGPAIVPRLVRRFLTVSAFSTRTLGIETGRTRVVHGGVDPLRFRPEPGGARSGVLFLGRLTPHKGIDVLIRALPPGAHLTVAGSEGHDRRPPERDYPRLLRQLGEGKDVSFAGTVPERLLPAIHRSPAVFVLPSVERTWYGREVGISELLGLVVLEAMASGTPVVASRVGGVPEVVADGETGLLVTPGDVEELRDRLGLLLGRPRLARRLGENARQAVLERFTWDAVADRCLAAYREVTSGEG